ncbi:MAG: hypothetical protein KDB23_08020 [Planctomycetales bacterium]|nr:hypothetical protein [Planctomycetales bacterium]
MRTLEATDARTENRLADFRRWLIGLLVTFVVIVITADIVLVDRYFLS